MSNYYEDDYEDSIDGDAPMDEICPSCHKTYDEVDYEYQICHLCNYDNNKAK